jgi:hypothetical protein
MASERLTASLMSAPNGARRVCGPFALPGATLYAAGNALGGSRHRDSDCRNNYGRTENAADDLNLLG